MSGKLAIGNHQKAICNLSLLNLVVSGVLSVCNGLTFRQSHPVSAGHPLRVRCPTFLPTVVLVKWNPDANLGVLLPIWGLSYVTLPRGLLGWLGLVFI